MVTFFNSVVRKMLQRNVSGVTSLLFRNVRNCLVLHLEGYCGYEMESHIIQRYDGIGGNVAEN